MNRMVNDLGSRVEAMAAEDEARLVAIRRDLHAHPETGFDTVRTAAIVADELRALGLAPRTGVGQTGVVAEIAGGRPGPVLVLRADMDALPIAEETGLPFASSVPGKMHACGHDLHTATLLGVARVLRDIAPGLAGTVRLMFQPAEETPVSGAEAMIRDGVLDGADMALGFHNYPEVPVGRFSYVRGVANGSSDDFDIVLRGRSGHAASPHQTSDPIIAAALLVLQIQTVVSREIDPMLPAVVTVGALQAGDTHNIIPERAILRGTARTQSDAARATIEAALRRLCAGIEASMRVTADLDWQRGTPCLDNDAGILAATVDVVEAHYGPVADEKPADLGAEDFAFVSQIVPTFQLGVGSGQPGRQDRLHNADYQPDEGCIRHGVVALSLAAARLLS